MHCSNAAGGGPVKTEQSAIVGTSQSRIEPAPQQTRIELALFDLGQHDRPDQDLAAGIGGTLTTGEQGALPGFDTLLTGAELLELLLEARDPLVELCCHADRS